MSLWDDIINHVCGFCEKDFKIESDLDIHIIKHHTKNRNAVDLKNSRNINDNNDASAINVIKTLSTTPNSSAEDDMVTCPAQCVGLETRRGVGR